MKCWEYLNCSEDIRSSCPAFNNSNGKECWMVSEKRCRGGVEKRPSIEEKLVECSRCDYYINVLKKK